MESININTKDVLYATGLTYYMVTSLLIRRMPRGETTKLGGPTGFANSPSKTVPASSLLLLKNTSFLLTYRMT